MFGQGAISPAGNRQASAALAAPFSAASAFPVLRSLQAQAAAEPNAPVRIGYLPITDATPLLVPHARGLFDTEGVQVEKPVMLRSWARVI